MITFYWEYKIESQNKKLIFSDRFIHTLKMNLFCDPDWLDLSREGDKRLQNQVDMFFSSGYLYTILHLVSKRLLFVVVSSTNQLFTQGPTHWFILRSRGSLPDLWVLWSSNRWKEMGRESLRLLTQAPLPTHSSPLFPPTYVFLRHTTSSFISQQRKGFQSWPNQYFSKDEYPVKTKLCIFLLQMTSLLLWQWSFNVESKRIKGNFGCMRL